MLTNRQKADYYTRMAAVIEQGWVRKNLETDEGVCLLGAADKVVSESWDDRRQLWLALDQDVIKHTRLGRFVGSRSDVNVYRPMNDDDRATAFWNDAPWRRKATVLKFLRARAAEYEVLAKDDRIAELEELVSYLTRQRDQARAKVDRLQREVEGLKASNRFLRASRIGAVEKDIFNTNRHLESLDFELNEAERKLIDA